MTLTNRIVVASFRLGTAVGFTYSRAVLGLRLTCRLTVIGLHLLHGVARPWRDFATLNLARTLRCHLM